MSQNNTGTYVYDKKLKKMVKISDKVPSRKPRSHICQGCCGHCACHEN